MNEIIKQLAEQAGFHFYNTHNVDGQDLGETIEADSWAAAEKFAQLILDEASKQGIKLIEGGPRWMDPELEGDTSYYYAAGACDTMVGMRDYFLSSSKDSIEEGEVLQLCPTCGAEWSGTSCGLDDCGWITGE